jgi:hypothetical protein
MQGIHSSSLLSEESPLATQLEVTRPTQRPPSRSTGDISLKGKSNLRSIRDTVRDTVTVYQSGKELIIEENHK